MEATAMHYHETCGEAALRTAGVSQPQLSQPLSYIILFSSRPGPPHWSAYLGFASPKLKSLAPHQPPPPGVPPAVNTAIAKQPNASWAIFQLRYEP